MGRTQRDVVVGQFVYVSICVRVFPVGFLQDGRELSTRNCLSFIFFKALFTSYHVIFSHWRVFLVLQHPVKINTLITACFQFGSSVCTTKPGSNQSEVQRTRVPKLHILNAGSQYFTCDTMWLEVHVNAHGLHRNRKRYIPAMRCIQHTTKFYMHFWSHCAAGQILWTS